ncbi:hypothetical protein AAE02nite_25850 [Adhaeribacter aerolatus]|uniref:DUF3784 domain-containing protein n=1 Tax=Adhaeribacter aerolatus TaxID=670289 RepID=A0A512AYX6_9BACT|nr:DUF3784 domain-containing protein [Adhaeribacter aerolatus]GEO04921.1 hypothetical protein AAE02nite_25850 [Adhaeribacter aerolatus]
MILLLNVGLGILFICLGFLVVKNPELIAGYNTLPKDQKERFNISGYALLMKRSFMLVGLLIIFLGVVSKVYWPDAFLLTSLVPILALVLYLNLVANRFK